jgi:hypothetical protein
VTPLLSHVCCGTRRMLQVINLVHLELLLARFEVLTHV